MPAANGVRRYMNIPEVADFLGKSQVYVRLLVMDGVLNPLGKEVYGATAAQQVNLLFEKKEVMKYIYENLTKERNTRDQLTYVIKMLNNLWLVVDEIRQHVEEPSYVDLRWISQRLGIHRVTLQKRLERKNDSGLLFLKGMESPIPCKKIEGRWKIYRKTLEKNMGNLFKGLDI